jgi:hypothetical protein
LEAKSSGYKEKKKKKKNTCPPVSASLESGNRLDSTHAR